MTPAGGRAPATIAATVAAASARFGPRLAVADGSTRISYAELGARVRRFGAALVASGVGPGDRVAVWAPNSIRWIESGLGVFAAGAVLVPVNTRLKGPEAADVLARSGVKVLVTVADFRHTDYVAMLRGTGAELPALATVVVADGAERAGTVAWDAFTARGAGAALAETDRRTAATRTDDPSDILFTSGTTGAPKGVVQTHGRTLLVATDWVAMTGLHADDRYLMVNPYFHMFGLKAGILAAVCAGATMLPEAVFDADRLLDVVATERITVLPGPPTLYQDLLDHPQRQERDLSSLRVAVTGAADIPVELVRRLHRELPFSLVVTGYGLTEAGTAAATSPGDDAEVVATTVGRARPGFELRILDRHGRPQPAGTSGELLVRGGSVMSHYLDDPEATAAALPADGWLRTGDIGVVDAAGYLRIVGRSKDMFIVGGFNAYPAEIENALLRHPQVRQVAVIGVADDRLGEVGMAFVVPQAGASVTPEAIIEWSRSEMANYKVPRVVELVDQLPSNASGKVLKDVLRAGAAEGDAPGAPG